MKGFLINTIIFSTLVLGSCLTVFFMEEGQSDPFYVRFTTPEQEALITGNSRAAQGLIPSVLNEQLSKAGVKSPPLFNYSFTLSNSPYGKVYLNSIKKKVAGTSTGGLFIVAVDPWSISVESETPDDDSTFPEADNFLAQLEDVSSSPNIDYLLNYYPDPYYNILLRRLRPNNLFLHDDGWLEVTVKMDSGIVEKRSKSKFKQYAKNAATFKFSNTRLQYLKETIRFFQQHGEVYLVRLPIPLEMQEVERILMPDFQDKIAGVVKECQVPYYDFTVDDPQSYLYTDGNHLYKTSAKEVSNKVASWILSERNAKTDAVARR